MGIFRQHVIPMIITCMLQGTLCDMGIPRTFYGGNIYSVAGLKELDGVRGGKCTLSLWQIR